MHTDRCLMQNWKRWWPDQDLLPSRSATYLQLPLPPDAVRFVDSAAALAQAAPLLEEAAQPGEAAVLGLDCEWEACTERRRSSSQHPPVSLLQVIQKFFSHRCGIAKFMPCS